METFIARAGRTPPFVGKTELTCDAPNSVYQAMPVTSMSGSHGIQEMTYEIVGMLMLAIFAVSMLYPWHPSWPNARWLVRMPLVLLPL